MDIIPFSLRISQIVVDVNKDMKGYILKNLGAPVDANDSIRLTDLNAHKTASVLDHPDGSVTLAKAAADIKSLLVLVL